MELPKVTYNKDNFYYILFLEYYYAFEIYSKLKKNYNSFKKASFCYKNTKKIVFIW